MVPVLPYALRGLRDLVSFFIRADSNIHGTLDKLLCTPQARQSAQGLISQGWRATMLPWW